jgi:uncharacterized protein (DUF1800 family)
MSDPMQETHWPHDPSEAWLVYQPSAQDPWDLGKVLRMHRRAGFGATWAEAQRDLTDGYEAAIVRVIGGAPSGPDGRSAAMIDAFSDAMFESYRTNAAGLDPIRSAWFYRMIFTAWPLRERVILAWHTHYATSEERVYEKSTLIEQHKKQRELWRSPVSKIHLAMLRDPAMLRWLDGTSNQRGSPNENLGREFLELFALGVGNYTEADVREAARALTGWQHVSERNPPLKYMPMLHDGSAKTIFGQAGAWADEDLARIASAHPAAARRIAWRLWRTFISNVDQPSVELLEGLAAPMRVNGDVDVVRGLEVLLRSRLFHSPVYSGRRVLSPVEWTVSIARAGETFPPNPNLIELTAAADRMGQRLFAPPNVAGWPGGLEWLSDPALVARQNFAAWLTSGESAVPADHWQQLAKKYGTVGPDEELNFWSALFWGRMLDKEERAALSAQLHIDTSSERAALVAAILGAASAQLA